jgi:hypothetical protein
LGMRLRGRAEHFSQAPKRVVAGDEVDHRRAASLVTSFAAGVTVRGAELAATRAKATNLSVPAARSGSRGGARTDNAHVAPACSSPPSVAFRPRVAARSSMSGPSLPVAQATSVLTSVRVPGRVVRRGLSAVAVSALIATLRRAPPARGSAFADERRGGCRRWRRPGADVKRPRTADYATTWILLSPKRLHSLPRSGRSVGQTEPGCSSVECGRRGSEETHISPVGAKRPHRALRRAPIYSQFLANAPVETGARRGLRADQAREP